MEKWIDNEALEFEREFRRQHVLYIDPLAFLEINKNNTMDKIVAKFDCWEAKPS